MRATDGLATAEVLERYGVPQPIGVPARAPRPRTSCVTSSTSSRARRSGSTSATGFRRRSGRGGLSRTGGGTHGVVLLFVVAVIEWVGAAPRGHPSFIPRIKERAPR